jgi:glycosyltransferase involved in cell wall biosynthesis
MAGFPSISVVIPTRGRPQIVQRAVASALGQTFHDLEVTVVIDGEDQATLASLSAIDDARLRIVALPSSVGGAEARNRGVRSAKGKWIAFLDDDDEWLPTKLERQLEEALKASVPFPVVCCAYWARLDSGDMLFGRRGPRPNEPISEYMFCRSGLIYGENAIATSVLFVPKVLMNAVPFDRMVKRHQDWDWALRALAYPGTALVYLDEPGAIYNMPSRAVRLSSSPDWRYSLAWCRERKACLTPRAFSYFIVSECLTKALQANAGIGSLRELFAAYWREGQPDLRSFQMGLTSLLVPAWLRKLLRGTVLRISTS